VFIGHDATVIGGKSVRCRIKRLQTRFSDPATVRCPKVNNKLRRGAVPTHTGPLETLIEYHLAARFGKPTADRINLLFSHRIIHVRFKFMETV